ncbi:PREDICTED: putative late blight resistance protein homolog R1B-14 [Ipomoea nil]|uniref:putative late blight resistance protein homolog R1B-14 n=1 Tax=Ipomoea nil TaxID=35883 RepID=UPI0009017343|nr:PREDICTED: putative late blight resistance protein homolog R1B-14 [Ipomoea nil]
MAFVAVTSLLGVVDQHFLQFNPFLNNILDDSQIAVSLFHKLRSLQTFLEESEIQTADEALDAKIRDVAVEAEAKIESKLREVYFASSNGDRGLRNTLQSVAKEIESLESPIEIHKQKLPAKEPSTPPQAAAEISVISGSAHHNLAAENEMIGCEDQLQRISELLIDKQLSKNREVVAVTGMGGIGKTTLARTVYEDSEIKSFFDISAWTVVSHQHNKKEILLRLLGCIVPLTSEIYKKDDGELADQLRKSLMGQRYLIVVDDIWNTKAWDDIQGCFPDNMNSSRILMTTRHDEVAKYVDSSGQLGKFTHLMRFLHPDESWKLFSLKVSGEKDFNRSGFAEIGKNIVKECQGLPLSIVVIAGLLAKLIESKQWRDVADNVRSLDRVDPSKTCSRVLSLSYSYLPGHLKACFLYFGVFPEDSDILVGKLAKLWAAEGFLMSGKNMSLEEVSVIYLFDLISRSLVQVNTRSFDGKIKSCKLHDLLHEICVREARKENLMDAQSGSKSSSRWITCRKNQWPITQATHGNHVLDRIRSFLHFGKDIYLAKCKLEFPCLKLLRVLDLSLIKYWHGVPSGLEDLVHLRYLGLTTIGSLYNFQLLKLKNLQTLVVHSWREEDRLQLPINILDLPLLRHAHLSRRAALYLPNSVQESLQSLYWVKVANVDQKTNFTRVPKLKELGIYIDDKLPHGALDSLVHLDRLEKLKFEVGRAERFSLPAALSPNLKTLSLRYTYLPWKQMDIIGKLPHLEVLKLKDFAFCGSKWNPSEEGFKNLKLFLIARSDLKHWNASPEHFPALKRLVLKNCWDLVSIPNEFAEIYTLESIELESCYSSLVKSAEEIKDQLKDFGGNDLIVRKLGIKDKTPEEESETEEEDSEGSDDDGN